MQEKITNDIQGDFKKMKTLNKRVFLLLALLAVVLSCGFFDKKRISRNENRIRNY